MAPRSAFTEFNLQSRSTFPGLAEQLTNPRDIFSILLIIGGDIVQRALAQTVGSRTRIAPVAFSFGWVAYAVSSVVGAIGEGKLLPAPDYPCVVINARTGYIRDNKAWVLGRILRDWRKENGWAGHSLVATVVRASTTGTLGVPKLDIVWWIGVVVIVIQLVLSTIPAISYNSWSCMTITFCGTLLALIHGCLPQWAEEKWAARSLNGTNAMQATVSKPPKKEKTVIITQGNGSNHVLVIISDGVGLDLEDLAGCRFTRNVTTVPATLLLATLWLCLLLVAAGSTDHGWYLLGIGSLGMCQNILTAGVRRAPSALGIHVEHVVDIMPDTKAKSKSSKVFAVLQKLEEFHDPSRGLDRRIPGGLDFVGLSLLPVFFPGAMRPEELQWKENRINIYRKRP